MLELAKEMDELASDIVVCGMVPNDVSLRQVVERLLKELGRGCTEKKRLHTMKVFHYADKKKLLFGPLSWLTELLRLVMCPKQTLERVHQELIASGLLGSAETPNSGTEGHARSPGFCAHGKCRTGRPSLRSIPTC